MSNEFTMTSKFLSSILRRRRIANLLCSSCGKPIKAGDRAYRRLSRKVRYHHIECWRKSFIG